MKVKNLVIGAGLSGVVLAERIASELKEEVLILEQRNHIGGNCFDYQDQNGIHVHQYGPHIFHTNNERVWQYLSQFTEWQIFMNRVEAFIDGNLVNIPFNLDSLHKVFPEFMAKNLEEKLINLFSYNQSVPIIELQKIDDPDLKFLADYVFRKVFLGYTIKQWGMSPEELDPAVFSRVPVLVSRDNRYFQDRYQGLPEQGYTKMIECMLKSPLISVKLNEKFEKNQDKYQYDRLFFTGPIDEYFGYSLGELPYRSLQFKFVELEKEKFQKTAVVNYPENFNFTRITEYKTFLDEQSSKTILSYEYPEPFEKGKNERYYPIPNEKNQRGYEEYLDMAQKEENVYFLGRLGDYKYYNMDVCVEKALTLFEELK